MRPSTHQRGGIYALSEDMEMKAKLTTLTRRLEELVMRNRHDVQGVNELPASHPSCFNCQSNGHHGEHCPVVPSVGDLKQEHAHVLGQNKPPTNAPYVNTYNPNWRNHLNLSWKPKPPAYAPQGAHQLFGSTSTQQQPPPSSPVEQAILNLSKVVGTFVEEQKVLNFQTNQKIERVESSLNQKIENMHYELESSIIRLSNQQQGLEKGKFPSQTQQNPRGVHEIGSASDPNARIDEVKAVVTLRSGKEPRPAKPTKKAPTVVEPSKEEQPAAGEEVKNSVQPPFPQALKKGKNSVNQTEILELLRQVKVNIPLLDMIKQVPTYAKIFKDLCTMKREFNVNKKAFLTVQVSAIIECKTPVKYKD